MSVFAVGGGTRPWFRRTRYAGSMRGIGSEFSRLLAAVFMQPPFNILVQDAGN